MGSIMRYSIRRGTAQFRRERPCHWATWGVRNGAVSEPQNFRLNGESTGDGPSEPVTPEIFVNDVEVSEGDSGNTTAVFTVTLSEAAAAPVTGTAVWRDDSATGSSDYLGTSQQFTFDPGETQLSVPVEIIGDTDVEQDELFFVDLQNVTGAVSGDLTGQATILNDDQSQTDPPHDCVEIEFLVTSDWGSGFNGEIRLTNRGETAWSEWTLEFDFGRDLTAIWNAELLSHIGDHYTVRDAGWNGIVAPGVTRSFGFTANPGNVTVEPQKLPAEWIGRVQWAWFPAEHRQYLCDGGRYGSECCRFYGHAGPIVRINGNGRLLHLRRDGHFGQRFSGSLGNYHVCSRDDFTDRYSYGSW